MSRSILKIACGLCVIALVACGVQILGKSMHLGFHYANAEQYSAGGATLDGAVKNLDISWLDGAVNIAYHAQNTVEIAETAPKPISGDKALRWWLDGDTLRIRYCKSGFFSLHGLEKTLTLTLPEGVALDSVGIDATSADVNVPRLEANAVTADLTSGDLDLRLSGAAEQVKLCGTSAGLRVTLADAKSVTVSTTSGAIVLDETGAAESVSLSSTSGSIRMNVADAGTVNVTTTSGAIALEGGAARKARLGSTSGAIDIRLTAFDDLRVNSTSGGVTAALPTAPGFHADIDTTSGSFDSAIALSREGSRYTCGDGSASVEIGTTSGDVRLEEVGE